MKKVILYVVLVLVIVALGYTGCKKFQGPSDEVFLHTIDSLHKQNDSLQVELVKDSLEIDSLNIVAVELDYAAKYAKKKVEYVVKYVDSSKKVVETLNDSALVSTFNQRYPADTVSNKLEVAKPVLVSAAQDLIELDGARQIIPIKDSIISLKDAGLANKDIIIGKYVSKENKYKLIIENKDLEVTNWMNQYNQLQIQNKKLQLKSKFQKIGLYLIIGGLTYMTLQK